MKNYFTNIKTVEELKKQYFALAKKYHSDITGGSAEIMKEINNEYAELHKKYSLYNYNSVFICTRSKILPVIRIGRIRNIRIFIRCLWQLDFKFCTFIC